MALGHDNRAHYSILNRENGRWTVEERHIEYDTAAAIAAIEEWCERIGTPEWAVPLTAQVKYGIDYTSRFLKSLYALAGQSGGVVTNEIWRAHNFNINENSERTDSK
jgi:hypothetical protein